MVTVCHQMSEYDFTWVSKYVCRPRYSLSVLVPFVCRHIPTVIHIFEHGEEL